MCVCHIYAPCFISMQLASFLPIMIRPLLSFQSLASSHFLFTIHPRPINSPWLVTINSPYMYLSCWYIEISSLLSMCVFVFLFRTKKEKKKKTPLSSHPRLIFSYSLDSMMIRQGTQEAKWYLQMISSSSPWYITNQFPLYHLSLPLFLFFPYWEVYALLGKERERIKLKRNSLSLPLILS